MSNFRFLTLLGIPDFKHESRHIRDFSGFDRVIQYVALCFDASRTFHLNFSGLTRRKIFLNPKHRRKYVNFNDIYTRNVPRSKTYYQKRHKLENREVIYTYYIVCVFLNSWITILGLRLKAAVLH